MTKKCPTCECDFTPRPKQPGQIYCSRSCNQSRASGGDSVRLRQADAQRRTRTLRLSAKQVEDLERREVAEAHARLKAEFLEREQRRAAA